MSTNSFPALSFAKSPWPEFPKKVVRLAVSDYEDTVNVLADHLTMYHSGIEREGETKERRVSDAGNQSAKPRTLPNGTRKAHLDGSESEVERKRSLQRLAERRDESTFVKVDLNSLKMGKYQPTRPIMSE